MLSFFVIGHCEHFDFGCTDLASSAIGQLQAIFSLVEVFCLIAKVSNVRVQITDTDWNGQKVDFCLHLGLMSFRSF